MKLGCGGGGVFVTLSYIIILFFQGFFCLRNMNFCSSALRKGAALSQSAVEGAQSAIAAKSEETTVALLEDLKIFDK
jgi:hypothetical protein